MFIKNAELTVDGVTASDEASNVTFAPSQTTATFTPVSGKAINDNISESWVCNMTVGQDWVTSDSLANTLYERAGEVVPITWKNTANGATFTALGTLVSPGPGGAAGVAESQVSIPLQGKPSKTAPTP